MKVKLLRLKLTDKWINSIKALRGVTRLGLKESKDIVDSMRAAQATPEIIVNFTDQRDEDEFTAHFAYERTGGQLRLFMITTENGWHTLILSEYKSTAEDQVESNTGYTIRFSREITGPFNDGTILAEYED